VKLTVIGYWGAYPGPDEASSGYLVEEGDEKVLLDCGSAVFSRLYSYVKPEELNHIVLTHYHADHIADVGCVQHGAKVQKSLGERQLPISIYGHDEDEYFNTLSYEDVVIGKAFEEGAVLKIGPFTLNFLRTPHPVPAYAVRIESESGALGYTGDTGWSDALVDFFADVDFLVCESSLYNRFKGKIPGHLTAGEAGRLARESRAGELLLTHLPHYGNHEDLLKESSIEYSGRILLAKSGFTWHT
jgi:ribonuclease BN (tRNA processing enzyme)